jgi:hypothetical protein
MFMSRTDAVGHVLGRVAGKVAIYDCPDLSAVEGHIMANWAHIAKAGSHAPITVDRLRYDIDLLLERWQYLHEMAR